MKCNPAKAVETTKDLTGCPENSVCVDNGTENSYCSCDKKLDINQNYSSSDKNSKYCIEKKIETPSTTPPPPKATEVSTTKVASTVTSTTPTTKAAPTTVAPTTVASTVTSTTPTTTTIKPAPIIKTTVKPDDGDVKVKPAPDGHHVLGGIMLPLLLVLGFIGAVFAIRKYDLIERAHGFIRNRNQQTRYNGLMENDFDDDPLLI